MRETLMQRLRRAFMGLDRVDPVMRFDGERSMKRRVYLDTTATALMPVPVWAGLKDYLEASSANSHTDAHRAGRDTTRAIEDSRDAVGRLVGYDRDKDAVLFTSNGATGAINFLARYLFPPELRTAIKRFPKGAPTAWLETLECALGPDASAALARMIERPLVVTSVMEHHSNQLPWIEAVGRHNLRFVDVDADAGTLDLSQLDAILEREGHRVRLVAITAVSNVTGLTNAVHDIAARAHAVGALIMVDGAQWVPHAKVSIHTGIPGQDIDYLVLSGHKLYAPGSRGALIGSQLALDETRCVTDVGGGMVEYVSVEDFILKSDVTAREEPGTPNIPGSISMGLVAELLLHLDMELVEREEMQLTRRLIDRLSKIEGVVVVGSTDLDAVPRAGVVAFDVTGVHHGLVAAFLNDFHNVAVRNGCFCAQPYVQRLLKLDCDIEQRYEQEVRCGDRSQVPGLVRASLGIYSTEDDIEALGTALEDLIGHRERVKSLYRADRNGTFQRTDCEPLPTTFEVGSFVRSWLAES